MSVAPPSALLKPYDWHDHLLLESPVYLSPGAFLSLDSVSDLVACLSPRHMPLLPTSIRNCQTRDLGLKSSEKKKKSVLELEGSITINAERRNWCGASHRWVEELRVPGILSVYANTICA